jgi:hypothetical protein
MATIRPALDSLRKFAAAAAAARELPEWISELPRTQARRLERVLRAGQDGDGEKMKRFFREWLGWRRNPNSAEVAALYRILTSRRPVRWRADIPPEKVFPYLTRAVINEAKRQWSRERRTGSASLTCEDKLAARAIVRAGLSFDAAIERAPNRGGHPADTARWQRRIAALARDIDRLPTSQRRLLELLADGTAPADAVRECCGGKWSAYQTLQRRADLIMKRATMPRLVKKPRV